MPRLQEALKARAARIARHSPVQHAHAATFAAEAARAASGQDLAGWDAATAAWEATGHPHPLAYTLLRAASAASVYGCREAAVIRLQRAFRIETRLAPWPLPQPPTQQLPPRLYLHTI